jgi:putative oxidoreductase
VKKIAAASVTIPASAAPTSCNETFAGNLDMSSATTMPSGKNAGLTSRPIRLYEIFCSGFSFLQSPFLLVVRLYWGLQFMQTGWGKLHHLARTTAFFQSLGIPFPAVNAHCVSGLEFAGGLLLIVGLASRLTGFLLAGNMLVAYWTADHEALVSVFSDPGKFYGADPYTFLFASLLVLIFGAGFFSLDTAIARRWRKNK